MEDGVPMEAKRVRHNYLAIAVAAVACFLFEAVWYSLFLQAWLKGIGRRPRLADQLRASIRCCSMQPR